MDACDPATGEGTRFIFEQFDAEALFVAMRQALEVYGDREAWRRLMHNAMTRDWSWERQGPEYVALYEALKTGQ